MTELFLTNDFIFVDIGHFFNLNLGGFFRDLLYGEGDLGGWGYYSLVWKLLGLCSKLEIWYVSTGTCLVSENIAFSARISLILLKSTLFCILNNSMRAVLKIFYFCFQFLLDERLLLMKLSIMTHASGIRLAVAQNWPQIGKMIMAS